MVFIDADKDNYINYYNFILDENLLRTRGVICVDNTLFKSKVYLKDSSDANGLALRRFNQFVSADPRVEQVTPPPTTPPQPSPTRSSHNSSSSSSLNSPLPLFLCPGQVILPLRDGLSIIRRLPATSRDLKAQMVVRSKKEKPKTSIRYFS